MTHTNLRRNSFVALVLTTVLAAACGTSNGNSNPPEGSGGSGGSNKVTAGNICQRVAEIQCEGEAKCCASPGRDMATCTTQQKKACADNLGLDALSADPITAFDANKASVALDKFEALALKCDTSISLFAVGPDGFRSAASGTVAPGAACNPGMGTNRVAATTAAIASCQSPSANACLTSSMGDWKCTPRADSGAHCFTDANCKDGLYCDNPDLDADAGKCAARKATGMDCKLGNECTSYACKGEKCVDQTKDTAYCLAM